jgi:hypothetical protein
MRREEKEERKRYLNSIYWQVLSINYLCNMSYDGQWKRDKEPSEKLSKRQLQQKVYEILTTFNDNDIIITIDTTEAEKLGIDTSKIEQFLLDFREKFRFRYKI